jgi:hypothetical protein
MYESRALKANGEVEVDWHPLRSLHLDTAVDELVNQKGVVEVRLVLSDGSIYEARKLLDEPDEPDEPDEWEAT